MVPSYRGILPEWYPHPITHLDKPNIAASSAQFFTVLDAMKGYHQ